MQEKAFIIKFADLMMERGYSSLTVKPEEIAVFYKEENGFMQVILSIDYHLGFRLEPTQMNQIKHQLERLFPGQYQADIRIFTVFWGEHNEGIRELAQKDDDFWYVDKKEGRICIYENQRNDFYGVRILVEKALEICGTETLKEQNIPAAGRRTGIGRFVKHYSIVNLSLILLNIIIFLGLEWTGDTENASFMLAHGGMYPESVLMDHQWYRLLTCMFIHFGITHLGNNMLILFFLGDILERTVGSIKYLVIYIAAGLGGSLLSLGFMIKTGDYAVSGGASGAIFGVIGALIYIVIRNKGRLEHLTVKRLVFMAALSLYYGFTATGVDNLAHIGGLISGFAAAVILYRIRSVSGSSVQ